MFCETTRTLETKIFCLSAKTCITFLVSLARLLFFCIFFFLFYFLLCFFLFEKQKEQKKKHDELVQNSPGSLVTLIKKGSRAGNKGLNIGNDSLGGLGIFFFFCREKQQKSEKKKIKIRTDVLDEPRSTKEHVIFETIYCN